MWIHLWWVANLIGGSSKCICYSGAKYSCPITVYNIELDKVEVVTSDSNKKVSINGIGSYGVMMCKSMGWTTYKNTVTSVTVNSKLYNIQSESFNGFTKLATVTLSSATKLAAIGSKAFSGCTSLQTISFPSGMCGLGSGAFQGCTKLETVTIPECAYVFALNASAFQGCTALTEVSIKRKSIYFGDNCFKGCTALTKFTQSGNGVFSMSANLEYLNRVADEYPDLANPYPEVTFGKLIKSNYGTVGSSVFSGCAALTDVEFGTIKTLGANAFQNCGKLTQILIASATTINTNAFSQSTALSKLVYCGSSLASSSTGAKINLASTKVGNVTVVAELAVFSKPTRMDCENICGKGSFSDHADCKPTNKFTAFEISYQPRYQIVLAGLLMDYY